MQNKPNFRKAKMIFAVPENKANSNPIKSNLLDSQMNVNKVFTKGYENVPSRTRAKQTQSNPISNPAPGHADLKTTRRLCNLIIKLMQTREQKQQRQ
jgi:hypothetical protein